MLLITNVVLLYCCATSESCNCHLRKLLQLVCHLHKLLQLL